ncbi:DUF4136 domain-containing protein [Psychroflexus salis]|uniref:DUF4136 domain-containing protein n=1 Tax=Psychroflexus salis TaxID=1526574 RepID=A0A916ZP01_9FLAO|nr:DUF4136 domain-containing protein [Psychroflexus salis]GGE07047.1 hypothetical protein GCM10010831_05690 [Psychroflexus salis]
MKVLKLIPVLILFVALHGCSSVSVAVDYDKEVSFDNYKTFAFYKPGIDEVEISDLDKRRILRAIDRELTAKGMIKSENPDVLVNIFTEAEENINIYQNNFGWGWGPGWGWGWGMPMTSVSKNVEGSLFIDLIDRNKNQLVWQGLGKGILSMEMDKKEERINEIVTEILKKYPPKQK